LAVTTYHSPRDVPSLTPCVLQISSLYLSLSFYQAAIQISHNLLLHLLKLNHQLYVYTNLSYLLSTKFSHLIKFKLHITGKNLKELTFYFRLQVWHIAYFHSIELLCTYKYQCIHSSLLGNFICRSAKFFVSSRPLNSPNHNSETSFIAHRVHLHIR
jgi:hypothetical protein